jgi:hypothetical protein
MAATKATEATKEVAGKAFEAVFQSVRKAAEANMQLQQEALRQWSNFWTSSWSGAAQTSMPAPQIEAIREFQKKWTTAVSELAHKHRQVLDRQYDAAMDSLDDALKITDAKTPEEIRERTEQFYRKTIDCLREMSEAQIAEFQDMVNKWTDITTKSGN